MNSTHLPFILHVNTLWDYEGDDLHCCLSARRFWFQTCLQPGCVCYVNIKKMLVHNLSSFEKQKFNIQSSCILPIRTARHTSFPHQPTLYLTVSSCSFVFRFHSAYSPVKKKKEHFHRTLCSPMKISVHPYCFHKNEEGESEALD